MIKYVWLTLSLMISTCTFAFTYHKLADNDRANFSISSRSLNRIFIKDDTITDVYGIDGTYILQKDSDGSIYIIPSSNYSNKSFDVLIKSGNNHHYRLTLKSSDITAQAIGIMPLTADKRANEIEKKAPYTDMILNVVKSFETDDLPDGYVRIPLDNVKARQLNHYIIEPIQIIRGEHFQGTELQLTNASGKPLMINPQSIGCNNPIAVGADKLFLSKDESIFVYCISER